MRWRIPQDCHARYPRCEFLEQFQPFRAEDEFNATNPVALPPGRAKLADQAAADRIDDDDKHDRHRAGRLLQCRHRRAAVGQDHIRRERDQFRRLSRDSARYRRPPAVSMCRFRPTIQPNCLSPCRNAIVATCVFRIVRGGPGHEHADAPHPLPLLRARRDRPRRRRAAQQRDELAPFQFDRRAFGPR